MLESSLVFVDEWMSEVLVKPVVGHTFRFLGFTLLGTLIGGLYPYYDAMFGRWGRRYAWQTLETETLASFLNRVYWGAALGALVGVFAVANKIKNRRNGVPEWPDTPWVDESREEYNLWSRCPWFWRRR